MDVSWSWMGMLSRMWRSIHEISEIMYTVVSGGGVYRSEDNGQSWQRTPQDLREIGPTHATVGLERSSVVSGKSVPLLRSADRGATWTPLGETPSITVTQLAWSDAGLLVGTREGLWRWSSAHGWQQLLPARAV